MTRAEVAKRHYEKNREKCMEASTRWRKENPEKCKRYQRSSKLRREYGLTIEEWDTMFEAQGGLCAACGTDRPGGKAGVLQVDHNHRTGAVRGLLCNGCNAALGHVDDNISRLLDLINYISLKRKERSSD